MSEKKRSILAYHVVDTWERYLLFVTGLYGVVGYSGLAPAMVPAAWVCCGLCILLDIVKDRF